MDREQDRTKRGVSLPEDQNDTLFRAIPHWLESDPEWRPRACRRSSLCHQNFVWPLKWFYRDRSTKGSSLLLEVHLQCFASSTPNETLESLFQTPPCACLSGSQACQE